jgi:DNA-binding transcriptional MerR regulator
MSQANPSPSGRPSSVQVDQQLRQFNLNQFRSMGLVHVAGYGLLLLAFIDVLSILIPPQFLNPSWEFQVFGQLVERVPVPLLGLILIFWGENNPRAKFEPIAVRLLSWLTIALAVFFFSAIPLGVLNTIRIYENNEQRANFDLSQQIAQVSQIRNQIDRSTSLESIRAYLPLLGRPANAPPLADSELPATKQQLSEILRNREQLLRDANSRQVRRQNRLLLRQSVKWNLGSLVSGTIFVLIWVNTRWAR